MCYPLSPSPDLSASVHMARRVMQGCWRVSSRFYCVLCADDPALLDGREWQRVATRIGRARLHGREWQRVATRIGLAQLDGSEWQLALGLLSWMDANGSAW